MTKNDPGAVPGQSETLQAGCQGSAVQPDAATVEVIARLIYDGLTGRYKLMEWPEVHRELQADYRTAARAVLAHAASAPRPPAEQAVLEAALVYLHEWDTGEAIEAVLFHLRHTARALRQVRRQG